MMWLKSLCERVAVVMSCRIIESAWTWKQGFILVGRGRSRGRATSELWLRKPWVERLIRPNYNCRYGNRIIKEASSPDHESGQAWVWA